MFGPSLDDIAPMPMWKQGILVRQLDNAELRKLSHKLRIYTEILDIQQIVRMFVPDAGGITVKARDTGNYYETNEVQFLKADGTPLPLLIDYWVNDESRCDGAELVSVDYEKDKVVIKDWEDVNHVYTLSNFMKNWIELGGLYDCLDEFLELPTQTWMFDPEMPVVFVEDK